MSYGKEVVKIGELFAQIDDQMKESGMKLHIFHNWVHKDYHQQRMQDLQNRIAHLERILYPEAY